MPSWIEGVLDSSASVKSHCASASASTRLGDLGRLRAAGCEGGRCAVCDGGGIASVDHALMRRRFGTFATLLLPDMGGSCRVGGIGRVHRRIVEAVS